MNPSISDPFAVGQVIYQFKIVRYDVFQSKNGKNFLRFVFFLFYENEQFEEEQVFLLDENGNPNWSFYRFLDQFSRYGELKDTIVAEDFIGERGTCYIEFAHRNGRIHRNIQLTSLEDYYEEESYIN